jgi:radical SAM protein with 4Fe4S-binding SPASM domain
MNRYFSIVKEGFGRLFFIIPSTPEVAQIEITNRCNFNCVMCQRIPLKVPLKDMDYALYKKIINKIDKVNEVILTGWGEPLMHPNLLEMIKYAKTHHKRVSITSNGSLLTGKAIDDLIETKIDSISFSVDEIVPGNKTQTHPVQKQLENIKKFVKELKEKKALTQVIIQSTLHKGREHNLTEVIKWAYEAGADMVNINRLDLRFNKTLKRPNFQEETNFMEKIDKTFKKYPILVEFKSHTAYSGLLRRVYKLLVPFLGRGGTHCLRIYNYIYINNRGEVTPCCALPNWPVGNLLEEDLDKIWNNDMFNKFREHNYQRNICGKCDVLEISQYA